ncbi:hypothetical protein Aduo_019544 [Ancylostoma duodenale]
MHLHTWIAVASLYRINPGENEQLKHHCGTIYLNETKRPRFSSTGAAVPPNKYPFIAGIVSSKSDGDYRCTGVLISNRHVLTAAHCVYDLSRVEDSKNSCNPNGLLPIIDMTIYLGTKCPKPGECPNGEKRTPYKSRYINPHPLYNPCNNENDIALVELDKDAKPGEASPICMAEKNRQVEGPVTAVGYGMDARDRPDKMEPGLQEVNLTAIQEGNGKIDTMDRLTTTCFGDSGGPLIRVERSSKAVLFGITSGGNINCSLANPFKATELAHGLFIDVRHHLNWICDITGVCPLRATAYPNPLLDVEVSTMKASDIAEDMEEDQFY